MRTKRALALFLSLVAGGTALAQSAAPAPFVFDTGSEAVATVSYFAFSAKTVRFRGISGQLDYGQKPARFVLEVTIDATKLDSGSASDDDMLKAPAFFDVAKHPYIRFRGRKLTETGPTSARVDGLLTVRDVTKPLALKLDFNRPLSTLESEGQIAFTGETRFRRSAFGMKAYPLVVGNRVSLKVSGRLERRPPGG